MLNSKLKWIEITPFGKVVSSGEGGNDTPDVPPEDDDDIIYEGGVI
jgi:hypothetical protein